VTLAASARPPSFVRHSSILHTPPLLSLVSLAQPAPALIYTLSLHDALPISGLRDVLDGHGRGGLPRGDRQGGRTPIDCRNALLRSEEHTSELQSRFDLVCRLLLEKKNGRWHTTSRVVYTPSTKRTRTTVELP